MLTEKGAMFNFNAIQTFDIDNSVDSSVKTSFRFRTYVSTSKTVQSL